jgi:hypothetical protein
MIDQLIFFTLGWNITKYHSANMLNIDEGYPSIFIYTSDTLLSQFGWAAALALIITFSRPIEIATLGVRKDLHSNVFHAQPYHL